MRAGRSATTEDARPTSEHATRRRDAAATPAPTSGRSAKDDPVTEEVIDALVERHGETLDELAKR